MDKLEGHTAPSITVYFYLWNVDVTFTTPHFCRMMISTKFLANSWLDTFFLKDIRFICLTKISLQYTLLFNPHKYFWMGCYLHVKLFYHFIIYRIWLRKYSIKSVRFKNMKYFIDNELSLFRFEFCFYSNRVRLAYGAATEGKTHDATLVLGDRLVLLG